jgi:hypothetical protein
MSTYAVEEARRNLVSAQQRAELEKLLASVEVLAVVSGDPLIPPDIELPDKDCPIYVLWNRKWQKKAVNLYPAAFCNHDGLQPNHAAGLGNWTGMMKQVIRIGWPILSQHQGSDPRFLMRPN